MSRIHKKFAELKKKNQKALIPFITAGYPNLKKTAELICSLEENGADLIELGVPFSDPLADGPVIQASSKKSLEKGTTLKKILALVKNTRPKTQIPILLMGYLNPILHYGLRAFAKQAQAAGVDGLIVADLPPDEGKEISSLMHKHDIDLVYLLAPTSDEARLKKVVNASRGFVYYVSMTGVTGMKNRFSGSLYENISRAKKKTQLPICVGFGISVPADAKAVARSADGVIIGSALVKELLRYPNMPAGLFSRKFLRPFSEALGKETR